MKATMRAPQTHRACAMLGTCPGIQKTLMAGPQEKKSSWECEGSEAGLGQSQQEARVQGH